MSSTASEIKDQLRNVLSLRYDVETKLLNLSALGEDAILNQMGFFSGESKPEKLFRALMAVCDGLFKTAQEKRDAVSSISLAGNNINDVVQIMSLSDTFPDLVNLDLSRNQFKDLKALQKWRHRLRKLQTLLLNENPLEVTDPTTARKLRPGSQSYRTSAAFRLGRLNRSLAWLLRNPSLNHRSLSHRSLSHQSLNHRSLNPMRKYNNNNRC